MLLWCDGGWDCLLLLLSAAGARAFMTYDISWWLFGGNWSRNLVFVFFLFSGWLFQGMEFFSFSYEVDICILASQQVLAFEFFRYEYDFGQSPIYMCIYIYYPKWTTWGETLDNGDCTQLLLIRNHMFKVSQPSGIRSGVSPSMLSHRLVRRWYRGQPRSRSVLISVAGVIRAPVQVDAELSRRPVRWVTK